MLCNVFDVKVRHITSAVVVWLQRMQAVQGPSQHVKRKPCWWLNKGHLVRKVLWSTCVVDFYDLDSGVTADCRQGKKKAAAESGLMGKSPGSDAGAASSKAGRRARRNAKKAAADAKADVYAY